MLLIKCWLIWFCLDGYWKLAFWVSKQYSANRESYVTWKKNSVTCVSKIYKVPSQWNKQSKEMHSAPVGHSTWENLFSRKENKFLEGYQIENSALQSCVLVGVVVALGIRLRPSGDWSLDRDTNTFVMQQGLFVAVLNFLIFILDTSCSLPTANCKLLSWPWNKTIVTCTWNHKTQLKLIQEATRESRPLSRQYCSLDFLL